MLSETFQTQPNVTWLTADALFQKKMLKMTVNAEKYRPDGESHVPTKSGFWVRTKKKK